MNISFSRGSHDTGCPLVRCDLNLSEHAVTKLREKSVSGDLTCELDCKLAELHHGQATIEEDWVVLRDNIHNVAFQLLGPTMQKNRTG